MLNNKSPSSTNKKSVKSANIDEGFFRPDAANKIDYLTVKERSNITKKEGTITNESIQNLINLDTQSQESKKFLSRYGADDVDVEKFGFEQFLLGQ